jgi:ELWxxDGT repeat protein
MTCTKSITASMSRHHILLAVILAAAVILMSCSAKAESFSVRNLTDSTYLRFGKYLTQDETLTYRFSDCGGILFFAGSAGGGTSNAEPWISRGTATTTQQVADVYPGTTGSDPDEFTRVGEKVFFVAQDPVNGRELWMTNIDTLATTLVKNLRPGSLSSNPHALSECNGRLVFACEADPTVEGDELWVTDGTDAGTMLLMDIAPGSTDSRISNPKTFNGVTYFSATQSGVGSQLWRTDGTESGTFLIYDKVSDHFAYPRSITNFAQLNRVCFFAKDTTSGNRYALLSSDGTEGGTEVIASPVTDSHTDGGVTPPDRAVELNGHLFFRGGDLATGYELWSSDGTTAGTGIVKDIFNGTGSSSPHELVVFNNKIWFVADDGVRGEQLWCSDGTDTGTVLAHEFYNASKFDPPRPHALEVVGNKLLFKLLRDGFGLEWWSTDGTTVSSSPVTEIRPGPGSSISADNIPYSGEHVVVNGGLYFNANHPTLMRELFRIGSQPSVSLQPLDQLVAVGSFVSFDINTPSVPTPTCRWTKNKSPISGATNLSYVIPSVTIANAGTYQATLTSSDGTTSSEAAKLGVVDPVIPNTQAAYGGTIALKVTASAPAGTVLTYQWFHNGNLTDGTTSSGAIVAGATSSKLTITKATDAEAGQYTCIVGMESLSITCNPAEAQVVAKPAVTLDPVPSAIVSGSFSWQPAASNSPTSFAISGLPSGLTYNKTTGLISGIPNVSGTFNVKVTARNAAGNSSTQPFTLTIAALPDNALGTFGGYLERSATLNASMGGTITAAVAKTGSFSGRMKLGATTYSYRGRLVSPLSGNPTAVVTILRRGLSTLTLHLTFDVTSNTLTGTVGADATTAAINAARNTWNARLNPAAQYAGKYNAAIDIPTGSIGNAAVPQGLGWTQLTVSTSGAVRAVGKTSDGGTISFSTALWSDGRFPIHTALYVNHGSINGAQRITVGGTAPDYSGNRVVSSGLDWQKTGPSSTRDRTYKTGFALIALTSDGSKWIAPPRGTNVLNVADTAANAKIEFMEGGLATAAQKTSLLQTFQLTAANAAKFDPTSNPCKVTLTVSSSTGTFRGTFRLTDPNPSGSATPVTRSVTFYGILLQHTHRGWGWFLLPGMPNPTTSPATTLANSDILSGQVWVGIP